MISFIYLTDVYRDANHVPGTVLRPGDTAVVQADKVPNHKNEVLLEKIGNTV